MYFDPESLIAGNCYFVVAYFDKGMRIPEIETYIFVGKNLYLDDANGNNIWYFQSPETYLKSGPFDKLPAGDDHGVIMMEADILEASIKDFDGLQEFLEDVKKRIP